MSTSPEWQASIPLPGGSVACTVRRSTRARRLRVTVDPRRGVIVTVPARAARNRSEAERLGGSFLAERETWLRHHLDRQVRQQEELAVYGPIRDGGLFRFRGEAHRIRVLAGQGHARTTVSREATDDLDELVIRLGRSERRELPQILEAWLRVRARAIVEIQIDRHASALAVAPASVTIRDGRSRWGSCSKAKCLSFSWRLVLAPPEALETVVVHELAHLRVFGHGPDFWEIVAGRRPDHRHWRRWLRDHAVELHGALQTGDGPSK